MPTPSSGRGRLHTAIEQLRSIHISECPSVPLRMAKITELGWKKRCHLLCFVPIHVPASSNITSKHLSESQLLKIGSISLRWDWSKCHPTIYSLLIKTRLPLCPQCFYLFRGIHQPLFLLYIFAIHTLLHMHWNPWRRCEENNLINLTK